MNWRLLVEERIVNIGIPLEIFSFNYLLCFELIFRGLGSLRTRLLYILGELAGSRSVGLRLLALVTGDR